MDFAKAANVFEVILNCGFTIYGFYLTIGGLILYIAILALLIFIIKILLR